MSSYGCAVTHCTSKRGCGVSFKQFPHCSVLTPKWLQQFPRGFRPARYARVCSLHFDDSQWEKDRVDGTRQLKASAVPTVNMTACDSPKQPKPAIIIVKRVLGDITNSINNNFDHMYTMKKAPPPQTIHTPRRSVKPTVVVTPCAPSIPRPVLTPCAPSIPRPVRLDMASEACEVASNPISDNYILCPETGFILPSPQPSKVCDTPPLSHSVEHSEFPSPTIDEQFMFTQFASTPSPPEPVELSEVVLNTPPPSESKVRPAIDNRFMLEQTASILSSTEASQVPSLSTSSPEELLLIVLEQRKRIEYLEEEAREKDRANAALKKAHQRLKVKANKEDKQFAPWLHKTQHRLLFKASRGGIKWHMDLIREGLILKMKAGSSGYSAFVNRIPLLPSLRLLQLSVQFIKFDSGLFHEIFDLLEVAAEEMNPADKDCQIVLDEMSIEKAVVFCRSNNKWLGQATFPSHKGIAGKALIIILAGIRRRWKCAVAAYLTSSAKGEDTITSTEEQDPDLLEEELLSTGEAYKCIINQVLRKSEEIGLRVAGVTSDMGPENLAFWRVFGVVAKRGEPVVSSVQNPFRNAPFFFLPDGIHLLKAIKTTTESNKIVVLPPELVASEGLQCDTVDYSHIQELYDFEEQFELKVAFRLKPENINCNQQFSKMKMGTHRAVICHRTSVALNLLSEEKGKEAYRTTAWFIEQLNNFFDLITSRSRPLALSRDNEFVYEKSIALIKKMSYLFENLRFGEKGLWKPCQRGMMVLCNSLLGLQERFLSPIGDYKFLSLGRFLSDCVENIISLIRQAQPVPNAVAFFQNLKVVTLSQLSEAVKGSGYDYEEADRLPGVDMLEVARQKAQERAATKFIESLDEMVIDPAERVTKKDTEEIGAWEQRVLYDMAGSVIRNIMKANVTVCFVCLHAAQWQEECEAHPQAKVTVAKEYYAFREDCSTMLQIYPSDEVFQAILIAELTFKKFRAKSMHLSTANAEHFFVENLMYVWNDSSLPDCHQIGRKILSFFIRTRFQQYGNKVKQSIKEADKNKAPRRNSKSCGMRDSANRMTVKPRKNKKKPTCKQTNENKRPASANKRQAGEKKKPTKSNKKPADGTDKPASAKKSVAPRRNRQPCATLKSK